MNSKRRIFLYGNSVILGTVGASLKRFPQFEVTTIPPSFPQVGKMMEMAPDAVIFDLAATHPEEALCWFEHCPNLLLIGMSPDSNLVRTWSGKQLRELTSQGLLEVIDEQTKHKTFHTQTLNEQAQSKKGEKRA